MAISLFHVIKVASRPWPFQIISKPRRLSPISPYSADSHAAVYATFGTSTLKNGS